MGQAGLLGLLGFDANRAEIQTALDDAEQYEMLIDELVEARIAAGLTQSAVAKAMGTTQSAVSDLERLGGNARISTLQRYARAVGGRLAVSYLAEQAHLSPVGHTIGAQR